MKEADGVLSTPRTHSPAENTLQALDDEEPTAAQLVRPPAGMSNLPDFCPNDWAPAALIRRRGFLVRNASGAERFLQDDVVSFCGECFAYALEAHLD